MNSGLPSPCLALHTTACQCVTARGPDQRRPERTLTPLETLPSSQVTLLPRQVVTASPDDQTQDLSAVEREDVSPEFAAIVHAGLVFRGRARPTKRAEREDGNRSEQPNLTHAKSLES